MVAQQDLHDNKLALQNYHAYLALTPRPANWNAVNDIANSLRPADDRDGCGFAPGDSKPASHRTLAVRKRIEIATNRSPGYHCHKTVAGFSPRHRDRLRRPKWSKSSRNR